MAFFESSGAGSSGSERDEGQGEDDGGFEELHD